MCYTRQVTALVPQQFAGFYKSKGSHTKILAFTAQRRSDEPREQYVQDTSVYAAEMLVFLDETGSDRRNCLRHYGYALPLYRPLRLRIT